MHSHFLDIAIIYKYAYTHKCMHTINTYTLHNMYIRAIKNSKIADKVFFQGISNDQSSIRSKLTAQVKTLINCIQSSSLCTSCCGTLKMNLYMYVFV